ncbi:MAG: nickel transport complex protein NikM subunit, transrane [Cytophagaceae bacterium]|jgi:hypothetical protein|nr:nickel transport complex protein NikM subunit, transrane [Cytophagaceae bacterium]
MKTIIKNLLFPLCLLFISTVSFAHNIWIETSAKGKSGQVHTAKIFLGGYGENERDSTQKWFSNTAEAVIWLTAPDGSQKELTKTAVGNGFTTSFTPTQDGVYTLSVKHDVAEVFGTTKYIYYAAAKVQVGTAVTGKEWATFSDFAIQTNVKGKELKVKALFKNQVAADASLAVGAPSGWMKHLEAKAGEATVEAIWNGLYVVEASYREKATGTHNGKEYKAVMHIATFDTEVNNK